MGGKKHTVVRHGFALAYLLEEIGFFLLDIGWEALILRVLHGGSYFFAVLFSLGFIGFFGEAGLLAGLTLEGAAEGGIVAALVVEVDCVGWG